MADRNVPVGCTIPAAEYRALTRIAAERSTPDRPVQVHHLIEDLVSRALHGRPPAPPAAVQTAPPALPHQRVRQVDRDELRQLHTDGLTDKAIAEALGVHRETVREHRSAMGLPPNTRTQRQVDLEQLIELHSQGLNDGEIATAMDLSVGTVGWWRRDRLGLPKNASAGRPRTKNREETAA